MTRATFGRRYLALWLDLLLLEWISPWIVAPWFHSSDNRGLFIGFFEYWSSHPPEARTFWFFWGSYFCALSLVWIYYFACFTSVCGQTPGKKILGIKVTQVDGNPVQGLPSIFRFPIALIMSVVSLGFSYFWSTWDTKNQALHDKFSRTQVIRTRT